MLPTRRRFLSALGASAAALPLLAHPAFANRIAAAPHAHILILVELSGGNDGLNTVIPVTDPAYRALRPTLGIARDRALTLDADTGLHPSMRALSDLWEAGDLRIIEGVGYPDPNRSHFRSIEIWNAGLGAHSETQSGWISTAFAGRAPAARVASGLVLGGDMGPLRGPGRFADLRDGAAFPGSVESMPGQPHPVRPSLRSPLDHVLQTYENARLIGDRITRHLERRASRELPFPDTEIGAQLRTAARLLEAGVDAPVLKVVQNGFDTHDAQPERHAVLLHDLSEAMGAFARAMRDIGLWDHTTLVTYSEFGRTARENASGGTDHGTAAPVLVAGGAVRGGLGGKRVALQAGDLDHTTDYRDLYSAILSELWGIENALRPDASRQGLRLF